VNFTEKLERLKQLDDLVLFKWTSSVKRIGGQFIPLSELRLNILSSNAGVVHFSVSAPVLSLVNGRPRIRFYDEGVLRVVSGGRKGINILASYLKSDEQAVEVRNIMHLDCKEGCSHVVEEMVLSMGRANSYPVCGVAMPDLFRITDKPETIRPLWSKPVLELIGGVREDTPEQLKTKFMAHLGWFGYRSEIGYVFNYNHVAYGGMVCSTTAGITRSGGSAVCQMPLGLLKQQLLQDGWGIHLEEKDEVA